MKVAAHICQNLLASAWLSWLQRMDEAAATRTAIYHHRHLLMREGLAGLFANATQRRMLRRHIQAMQQRQLRCAWNAWSSLVQAAQARAALADVMRARLERRLDLNTSAKSFDALRAWVKKQQDVRELLSKVRHACSESVWSDRCILICDAHVFDLLWNSSNVART